jgi:hypothetical protein
MNCISLASNILLSMCSIESKREKKTPIEISDDDESDNQDKGDDGGSEVFFHISRIRRIMVV